MKSTKKVNIITLGCSKNIVDSEALAGKLKLNGHKVIHNNNDNTADIVIVNTCGFIDEAKTESIDTILNVTSSKSTNTRRKVFVMGCLSERYKDKLSKNLPEVDLYFGLNESKKIIESIGVNEKNQLVGDRDLITPSHYAYLKISEGCDRTCSFCAIPIIRGGHISKRIEDIILEAQNLALMGVKELILIAQDLTYYGRDIYKKPSIGTLLEKLTKIPGIDWIRLHYAYPAGFPEDLPDIIRDNPKINNYLDLPVQHINEHVLKLMRRGISAKDTIELLNVLRKKIPDLSLRTTLIVGHPGESPKAYDELKNFVIDQEFDRLGIFKYSHEEDTWSFKNFKDDIPDLLKTERLEELHGIQTNISLKLNNKKVGREYDVILDRIEDKYYVGRTRYDSPEIDNEVLIKANQAGLNIGQIYKTRIIDAEEFDLYAEII